MFDPEKLDRFEGRSLSTRSHSAFITPTTAAVMAVSADAILHGGKSQLGKIPRIQIEFDDALPARKPEPPNTPVLE